MNKINYNQASEFCQKMATKYSELAKLNNDLAFLSKELDNKTESLDLLQQRFLTLQEENKLNKQLLNSKSNYCKEVEAELEMILENQRLQEEFKSKQTQVNLDRLLNNLDTIYSSINTSVLSEHYDYLKELEKDSAPFVFEEILEHLKMLINLKELYDQGQEDGQEEHLLEF